MRANAAIDSRQAKAIAFDAGYGMLPWSSPETKEACV